MSRRSLSVIRGNEAGTRRVFTNEKTCSILITMPLAQAKTVHNATASRHGYNAPGETRHKTEMVATWWHRYQEFMTRQCSPSTKWVKRVFVRDCTSSRKSPARRGS